MISHLNKILKIQFIIFSYFHKYIFYEICKSKNCKYIELRILKYTK